MDNKKGPKGPYKFVCEKCHYYSNKKSQYDRHIQTKKHNDNINGNNNGIKKTLNICVCGKSYKFLSGLSRHKKKCSYREKDTIEDISNNVIVLSNEIIKQKNEEIKDLKQMFMKMMDSNKDLQKIIYEQNEKLEKQNEKLIELAKQPKTYIKNQNNFNLENFLNVQCKDAMNLTDFVESLQVTFKDLLYLGDNGFVKSIQNSFVKQLKNMEQTKRPIHCTDKKRKTIYIKDENEWNKDEDHSKVNKALRKYNSKQYKALTAWFKENPNWCNNENIQMSCLHIMQKLDGLVEEKGEKNKKKIMNRIIENTIVDKE